jgi:hypothetical protein
MPHRRCVRRESPQIPALAGGRITFARIKAEFARLEMFNHSGPLTPRVGSEPLCARHWSGARESDYWRYVGPGGRWPRTLRRDALRGGATTSSPGNGSEKFLGFRSHLFDNRAPLACVPWPMTRPLWAEAVSLRRVAPWITRWLWPGGLSVPHVFLRGCDETPPGQIRPPGWRVLFLPAYPSSRVPLFLLQA